MQYPLRQLLSFVPVYTDILYDIFFFFTATLIRKLKIKKKKNGVTSYNIFI